MSIRVRVPEGARHSVRFASSPALEAILSLSVLAQPSHHPLHHDWVRSTRRRLPPEVKQRLADFRFQHMEYIPAGLLPVPGPRPIGFEDDMARISALPLEARLDPSEIGSERDRWIDEWIALLEG